MCGIVGFNWDNKKLILTMSRELEHRGPDGNGTYNDENVSLAHRRLAIIDLSEKGKQPMCNEDGSIWITFNGEIYNYQDIKEKLGKNHQYKSHTDTEVIIHAYEEYGINCVNLLDGDFAFCIYDSNKKQLFLARDKIGVKPLYYYLKNDKFVFASEIKAILKNDFVRKEINKDALNWFIALRYIPYKQTIYNNIYRLLPGQYAVYDLKANSFKSGFYWNIDINKKARYSTPYMTKMILDLLEKSVEKRLMSDVPLGVYLSGGVDSSAIVAMMSRINKKNNSDQKIKSFSVGFEQGEDVNELKFAKQVSDLFGTDHKEYTLKSDVVKLLPKVMWHLDEPMADPALIPVYFLSEKAKKDVTVILTGDGGDELFAGYDQYRILSTGNKLSKVPFTNMISSVMNVIPSKILDKYYKSASKMGQDSFKKIDLMIGDLKQNKYAEAYYDLTSIYDDEERKALLGENFTNFDYPKINEVYFNNKNSLVNRYLYFDFKNLLPESFLIKSDKMTMAHAVEGRVPFLDPQLAEFTFSLKGNLKLKQGVTKYILKKSLVNTLPMDLIYRKKQGFHVPVENWLNNDLKSELNSLTSNKELIKMNLFNMDEVRKIADNYNNGKLFYARKAWNLICFKTWYERFMVS